MLATRNRVMATGRINLTPLAPFDPLYEPTSLSRRWKEWKRRFEIYLLALNITNAKQKRAILLYQDGQATQDIFDTLPETGDDDDYDTAMSKLDEYFTPKKNIDYEIFKFRTAKQQQHETIEQYMTRLRKTATNCNFTNIDSEVKSTIIQNCQSKRLRRYALIEPDITFAKLIAEGRAYELSEIQASGIEQSLAPLSLHDEDSQPALTVVNTPRTHNDETVVARGHKQQDPFLPRVKPV